MDRPPYSLRQAVAIFKRAFTAEGRVVMSFHFRGAMADPDDPFTTEDLVSARSQARITRPPERDPRTGEWNYRAVGPDTEGRPLAIVFVTLGPNAIKLVTGFHTR